MRRTSVGNASVKDIPMLDVFLQRLDRRHSSNNYNNSDSKAGNCNKVANNTVKSKTAKAVAKVAEAVASKASKAGKAGTQAGQQAAVVKPAVKATTSP